MVSSLRDVVLFLSYLPKKSFLWDTVPKLVLLPWEQDTQTSSCLSSFMASSVVMLILSIKFFKSKVFLTIGAP